MRKDASRRKDDQALFCIDGIATTASLDTDENLHNCRKDIHVSKVKKREFQEDTASADSSPCKVCPSLSKRRKVEPHRFLDHYKSVDVFLGKGSFGSVSVYRRRATGEQFAVKKVLSCVDILGDKRREKVLTEIEVLRRLCDCQHIAQLQEAFREGNTFFLVFDLMAGGNLSAFLRDFGRLCELEASRVMSDIANALLALQRAGITHRDVKPANILCQFPGMASPAKLCDFDLAGLTGKGMRCRVGTHDYMSPEQVSAWQREPGVTYGQPTDLWSLGVVLFYLLYGKKPFRASCGNPDQCRKPQSCHECYRRLHRKIRSGSYSFPAVPWEVSDNGRDLIARLLVVNPSRRLWPVDVLTHDFVTDPHVGSGPGTPSYSS